MELATPRTILTTVDPPTAGCAETVTLGARQGKWRNGRRARFRSVCPKGRGGSTPPLPTHEHHRRAPGPKGSGARAFPLERWSSGGLPLGATEQPEAVERDQ